MAYLDRWYAQQRKQAGVKIQFMVRYAGLRPDQPPPLPEPLPTITACARTMRDAAVSAIVDLMQATGDALTEEQVSRLDRYAKACPRKPAGKRTKCLHYVTIQYSPTL